MTVHLRHQLELSLSRRGVVGRRDFLRGITAASVAAGTLSWRDLVTLQAGQLRKEGMACILLWMQGGPSHFETFSPKPHHANGGETKAISTSVSGIEVAEHYPKTAAMMHEAAIIRSMTPTTVSIPSLFAADTFSTDGLQPLKSLAIANRSTAMSSAPGRSALFTT